MARDPVNEISAGVLLHNNFHNIQPRRWRRPRGCEFHLRKLEISNSGIKFALGNARIGAQQVILDEHMGNGDLIPPDILVRKLIFLSNLIPIKFDRLKK
ncbi:hypothetical protein GWI33_017701 [Rhynchophorus ferrugineus]|uniref:Uncharacterized protein n=1 Tax=Rhynchophorus ferrugineus TaxID=354439 RepID=A0A834I1G1_RHYFE|nr:hypothetical protein GWI33_017701 [Rhynchophorus ferrugineus]